MPVNARDVEKFAFKAHLQAATFDIWRFARSHSQNSHNILGNLCFVCATDSARISRVLFSHHEYDACMEVSQFTFSRRLAERERTGLWGLQKAFSGPGQQVSNKHLF